MCHFAWSTATMLLMPLSLTWPPTMLSFGCTTWTRSGKIALTHQCTSTCNCCPISPRLLSPLPRSSFLMQVDRPPPPWLQNWRQLAMAALRASRIALRLQRPAPKTRSTTRRPTSSAAKAKLHQSPVQRHRPLQHTANTGTSRGQENRHGSYAQCLECLTKWKWNPTRQGWEHFVAASSSSQLPLPCSATVLDDSWNPPEELQPLTYTTSSMPTVSPYLRQDHAALSAAAPKRQAVPTIPLNQDDDLENYDHLDPIQNPWRLLETHQNPLQDEFEEDNYDWDAWNDWAATSSGLLEFCKLSTRSTTTCLLPRTSPRSTSWKCMRATPRSPTWLIGMISEQSNLLTSGTARTCLKRGAVIYGDKPSANTDHWWRSLRRIATPGISSTRTWIMQVVTEWMN